MEKQIVKDTTGLVLEIPTNLTPMQLGRINKVLDKKWNFGKLGIGTYRELINKGVFCKKQITDSMCDYSRIKFNRMGGYKEQEDYIKKLETTNKYNFVYSNTNECTSVEIGKLIFDVTKEIQL
jgi:hypothetical protein